MTYTEAVARATEIKAQVQSKKMPPWKADRSYTHFTAEKYLSPSEINKIVSWVDNGTPEGITAHAPVMPVYTTNAEISSPDKVFSMAPYTIPDTSSSDVYRCFVLPGSFTGTPYVVGLQVLPGNNSVVHHVLVFQDSTSTPDSLDAFDAAPGFDGFGAMSSSGGSLIGTWAPGTGAYFFPQHMGVRVKHNAKIVIQVHYPISGIGQMDSTKVLLKLSNDTTLRNVRIQPLLNEGLDMTDGPLHIGPDSVKTFHEAFQVPANMSLISLFPHMHMLGRSIKVYNVNAAGDTIPLINIPDWDFHWQGFYNVRRPIKLGDTSWLYAEAFYDNTTANPDNPHHPPVAVDAGYASTDEMMLTYFALVPYQPSDDTLIIDTSTYIPSYRNCAFPAAVEERNVSEISLYPNPAKDIVHLQFAEIFRGQLEVVNTLGEICKLLEINEEEINLDVHELPAGIYQLHFNSRQQQFCIKLLKE
jgi:hypothetical protein